jgi:hypothetical protein
MVEPRVSWAIQADVWSRRPWSSSSAKEHLPATGRCSSSRGQCGEGSDDAGQPRRGASARSPACIDPAPARPGGASCQARARAQSRSAPGWQELVDLIMRTARGSVHDRSRPPRVGTCAPVGARRPRAKRSTAGTRSAPQGVLSPGWRGGGVRSGASRVERPASATSYKVLQGPHRRRGVSLDRERAPRRRDLARREDRRRRIATTSGVITGIVPTSNRRRPRSSGTISVRAKLRDQPAPAPLHRRKRRCAACDRPRRRSPDLVLSLYPATIGRQAR